jgi:IS30 family transposase
LFPLPEGFTAQRMRPALTAAVLQLPQQLRRSLTWDHGKEMAEHLQFTIDSGVQVYFCDPRSPQGPGKVVECLVSLRRWLSRSRHRLSRSRHRLRDHASRSRRAGTLPADRPSA